MFITGIPRKDSPTRWRLVRQAVLNRDNYRCQECGRVARKPEVDHKVPLHRGGDAWSMDNLQTLCAWPCHGEKTRQENIARHARDKPKPRRDAWQKLVNELRT